VGQVDSSLEIDRLRSDVTELRQSLAELRDETSREIGELRDTVDDIKQQLGI
jgi:predicted  nucleic acid-binding Zn-ribbon protein